jgi:hypothetical protein
MRRTTYCRWRILHRLRRTPAPGSPCASTGGSIAGACGLFQRQRAAGLARGYTEEWKWPAHVSDRGRCLSAHHDRARCCRRDLCRAFRERESARFAQADRAFVYVQRGQSVSRTRAGRFRCQSSAAPAGSILVCSMATNLFSCAEWQWSRSAEGGHVSGHSSRRCARRLRIDEADCEHRRFGYHAVLPLRQAQSWDRIIRIAARDFGHPHSAAPGS